jgi:hypothetical protein
VETLAVTLVILEQCVELTRAWLREEIGRDPTHALTIERVRRNRK